MKPVTQVIVMDDIEPGTADNKVNAGEPAGDCVRACVASILERPLHQVPHFVQYIEHPAGTDPSLWWFALIGWCGLHDWRVQYNLSPVEGWAMVGGVSVRGHQHVCVALDGEIIHDPHPSGAGLTEITEWYSFKKRPIGV